MASNSAPNIEARFLENGGHDYDYVYRPPDRLVCKLCKLPCREARVSECCGNVFCKSDIETMSATTINFACPVCSNAPFKTHPNQAANRKIRKLNVYCPRKNKDGCGWIGEVRNVDEHLKGHITCSKCDQVVDHAVITNHLTSECPCYCQYCKVTAERIVIADQHKKNCHNFPVSCPNNCGAEGITRSELDDHKRVCPLEIINCNECGTKIARKDEKSHNEEYMTEHGSILRNRLLAVYNDSVDNMQENVQTFVNQAVDQIQAQIYDLNAAVKIKSKQIQNKRLKNILGTLILCIPLVVILVAMFVSHWDLAGTEHHNVEKTLQGSDHYDVHSQLNVFSKKVNDINEQVVVIAHVQTTTYIKLDFLEQFSTVYDNADGEDEQLAPVTLRMFNFFEKIKYKKAWQSIPFIAFWKGYRFCLIVYAAGYGSSEDSHVSVFLALMKGPYDDELEQSGHWPVRGTFKIELLDQLNDANNHIEHVTFDNADIDVVNRVLDGSIADSALGYLEFISHDMVYRQNYYTGYLINNTLCFRISYTDTNQHYPTAPVILKMYNSTEKIKKKKKWQSTPFMAFWRGYQMCLKVKFINDDSDEYMSVKLHVMKGSYDDNLDQSDYWPVRGTFKIELLSDTDNHVAYVLFDNATVDAKSRVMNGHTAINGWGALQFISYDSLFSNNKTCFIQNNTLSFRISYMDTYQHYLVAPVILKMFKFTERMEHKEKWFSSPFFAFWRGYQMCLAVDAAGAGVGEGTHLSVYLHLMKGPYDDELEQSGHWPLTGTFKVELLNQFSDSNHHVAYVSFNDINSHIEYRKRVLDDEIANTGFGVAQFLSHDDVHRDDSKYVKSNTLYFKVSFTITGKHYDIAPVILTMYNATETIKSNWQWFSSPFHTFWRGHQFCLLATDNDDNNDYMATYLNLMKGPYDDELEQSGHWPVRGTFKIELLNQLSDSDHHTTHVSLDIIDNRIGNKIIEGNIASYAVGNTKFISYDTLRLKISKYLKNNTLQFRVSYMVTNKLIAPVILKISDVFEKYKYKETWLSTPFFAFWRGYQMCLSVKVAGQFFNGEGHTSVYLHLMKGPYDDELEQSGHWPVRGTFTIELLNQLNDDDHHTAYVSYDNTDTTISGRVFDDEIAIGIGKDLFISNKKLIFSTKFFDFERDIDVLHFKISYNRQN